MFTKEMVKYMIGHKNRITGLNVFRVIQFTLACV